MRAHTLNVRQMVRVVLAMGWSDFVLKYRGSVLGYIWSFVGPLIKFLVILHVFRSFMSHVPDYALYLFLGIIVWEHFSMTTSACITMLHDKQVIIKKVPFPRILLIFSVGWTHVIILLSYFIIYLFASLFIGVGVPLSLWYLIVVVADATLLALGIGMLLSAYALRYRDVKHLWSVILQILFWLTPITYVYQASEPIHDALIRLAQRGGISSLWSLFDAFIRFQPLSILMHDTRRALLYPDTLGVPSIIHTIAFFMICIGIFAVGTVVFRRRSRYFVQEY